MAEVMTYNSLVEDVRRYIERGFPQDHEVYQQIPRLIANAQRAICDKFKIQGNINVVQSALVQGQFAYAKPDRWRETVSMFISAPGSSAGFPVFPRSYEYCRMYAPDTAEQDRPLFYADYDYFHWLFVPTPDLAYAWELTYYELPPLIDTANQTNWITDFAPNALLYRTLMDAAAFLKQDDRVQTFQGLYEEAVGNLDIQDLRKIVDRSSTRNEA